MQLLKWVHEDAVLAMQGGTDAMLGCTGTLAGEGEIFIGRGTYYMGARKMICVC